LGWRHVEPAARVERVVEDESAHGVTIAHEPLDEVTADEAFRSRYENARAATRHDSTTSARRLHTGSGTPARSHARGPAPGRDAWGDRKAPNRASQRDRLDRRYESKPQTADARHSRSRRPAFRPPAPRGPTTG